MMIDFVQKRNTVLIAMLGVVVVVLLFIVIIPSDTKQFEIKDSCGRFVNLISHTIPDEAACSSRCRAQCQAIDYDFDTVDFTASELGCHSCTCYCER